MTMKKELSDIKRVDIREVWPNKADNFTPWLAENISELGEALGLGPESMGLEAQVASDRLDILARDRGRDRLVAIENQLGETDDTHLGQLLTSMACHGTSVAVWVAGKFTDEHREALDLLNRRTDGESEFFGVVVEAWQIDGSRLDPHFWVVSPPNHWQKQTKAKCQVCDMTEQNRRYYQFFQGLVDNLGKGSDIPPTGKVNGKNWQSFSTGSAAFRYSAAFAVKDGGIARVEAYIDCGDKARNKARFDQLELQKKEIESEIGGKFDWERLEDKQACRISAMRKGSIGDDQRKLDEIRAWMIQTLLTFNKTFPPRLAKLD